MGILISFILGVIYCLSVAFSTISADKLMFAQEQCQANGGVNKIVADVVGPGNVYCDNGGKFRLKGEE